MGIPMSLAKLTVPLSIWAFLFVAVFKHKELMTEIFLGYSVSQ